MEGLTVNKTILDLVHKLLSLHEYDTIISELETFDDIELVLDYMLYVRMSSFSLRLISHIYPCILFRSYYAIIPYWILELHMPAGKLEDSCSV